MGSDWSRGGEGVGVEGEEDRGLDKGVEEACEQVEVDDCRASRDRLCGLGGGGEARGLTASNSGWLKFQVL